MQQQKKTHIQRETKLRGTIFGGERILCRTLTFQNLQLLKIQLVGTVSNISFFLVLFFFLLC